MDCLFCKIVKGEIPCKKVYEDENVFAFHDISPSAPTHIVCIPKMHIANASEISNENSYVIAQIFEVISKLSKDLGLADGFRVVTNCGDNGGQSVHHLHFHLLGGKKLTNDFA